MICDKCGKNNKSGMAKCTYCGADMPKLSGGNGFADILNFKPSEYEPSADRIDYAKTDSEAERMRALEMQKLNRKSDKIIDSTNKNTLLGLIAVVLCVIILISSLIVNVIMMSKLNDLEENVNRIKYSDGIETEEKNEEKDSSLKPEDPSNNPDGASGNTESSEPEAEPEESQSENKTADSIAEINNSYTDITSINTSSYFGGYRQFYEKIQQ